MLFATIAGSFSSELAIDLGTANTVVYARAQGIVLHEPSVIALQERPDGTRVPCSFGQAAKEMIGKTPSRISTVRPVRDGMVADCELTWFMLKYVIKRASKYRIGRRLRVIVGVSPSSSAVERRAIVEPTEAAGASEVYLIYDPLAAALGAGLAICEPCGNMVVDIGGGSTDIAIISLGDLVYSRTLPLGGNAMDAAVARMLRHKYQLEVGEQTAEWVKCMLGSTLRRKPVRCVMVKGNDSITGAPRTQEICSDDVCTALLEPIDTIIFSIQEAFETTPPELVADIAENGLTLTGGGALLDGLVPYLRRELGFPVHLASEPMACVALGAGYALEEASLRQQVTMRL